MSSDYYVYLYLDPTVPTECDLGFQPFYVGRGRGNRDTVHLKEAAKYAHASMDEIKAKRLNMLKIRKIHNLLLQSTPPIIVRKYENLSLDESKNLEVFLIAQYGRRFLGDGPLTNLTVGGEGRVVCHAGPFNPFYGKSVSIEHRKKLSAVHKGKTISQDQRSKISKSLKGKKNKLVGRVNKSIAVRKTIESNPMATQFQQLGNLKRKTWKLVSPTGQVFITTSLPKLCKTLGLIYKTLISAHRKNKPLQKGPNSGWTIECVTS